MKRHIIYILLIFFGWSAMAQSVEVRASSGGDTSAVSALIIQSFENLKSDPNSSFQYADKAVTLADQLGLMDSKYKAYKTLAIVNWELGKYGDAFFQLDRARRMLLVEAPGDSTRNAEIYYLTGQLNAARENYPAAIDLYNQALVFCSVESASATIMAVLIDKGRAYNLINDSAAAQQAFNQVILMHQKKPNKPFACNAYIELGKFEAAKRRFVEADKFYQLALGAIDQDKTSPLYVVLLGSQSLLEILKGDLNKALSYRKEELALLEKSGALEPLARSNAAIGEIYLKIENLADAEKHFKKALSIAEKMQRNSPLGQIFKGLADVYAKRGDYKQAFYFFRRYADHQDSLSQADRVRRIYDKATQYALDGKDKQITQEKQKLVEQERLIKEQNLERNGLIGFAVMVVLLLITAAVGLFQNRRSAIKLKQNNSMIQNQNKIIVEKNKVLEERNSRMVQLHTEKNNIIRVVSHDLKAPLNRINGLAQLIQIDPANTPMYLKYIADVVADGTRLIQDLLDISAIENNRLVLRRTLFNLSEDLTEVVNSYAGVSTKKSIEIKLEVPSEDLLIYSDEHAIRRVFENLLSNAIKFSPRERMVFIRIFKDGNKLCIAVKDQGPGLTQEDKEKLFTPYQRLSASPTAGENSTGLGLSIAKRLMEELHGDLWCESSEGLGACFIMELPYQLTPEEEPRQMEIPLQATVEDAIHPIVVVSEERPSIVFAGR